MKRWLWTMCCALCLACGSTLAQSPDRPIRVVVTFPAGGTADLVARLIGQALTKQLGQPVIIDNKPGGDGIVGAEHVRKSPADGNTLLFGTVTAFNAAPALHKNLPFDPVMDFTPIGRVGVFGFFVYATASFPAADMQEFASVVRARPGVFHYGSISGTSIFAAAQLTKTEQLTMNHVPYKGEALMYPDLISGRIHLAISTGIGLTHAKEGKLKVLATLLPARSPMAPNAPTLPEAGLQALTVIPWAGLFGPSGMKRDVVERLSRELRIALAQKELVDQVEQMAFSFQTSTPEEFAMLVKEQLILWRQVALDAGIQSQ